MVLVEFKIHLQFMQLSNWFGHDSSLWIKARNDIDSSREVRVQCDDVKSNKNKSFTFVCKIKSIGNDCCQNCDI